MRVSHSDLLTRKIKSIEALNSYRYFLSGTTDIAEVDWSAFRRDIDMIYPAPFTIAIDFSREQAGDFRSEILGMGNVGRVARQLLCGSGAAQASQCRRYEETKHIHVRSSEVDLRKIESEGQNDKLSKWGRRR